MQHNVHSRRGGLPIQAPVLAEVAHTVALTGRRSSPLRRMLLGQKEDLECQNQLNPEADLLTGHLAVL